MDIKKLAGERIGLAMKMRGMGREQLAEILDVSPTYVSKLLRGQTNVGIETLKGFADALKFPISFFLEADYTINLGQAESKAPKAHRQRSPSKEPAT